MCRGRMHVLNQRPQVVYGNAQSLTKGSPLFVCELHEHGVRTISHSSEVELQLPLRRKPRSFIEANPVHANGYFGERCFMYGMKQGDLQGHYPCHLGSFPRGMKAHPDRGMLREAFVQAIQITALSDFRQKGFTPCTIPGIAQLPFQVDFGDVVADDPVPSDENGTVRTDLIEAGPATVGQAHFFQPFERKKDGLQHFLRRIFNGLQDSDDAHRFSA